MEKAFAGSFVSEHMLINTRLMKEMIKYIEGNQQIDGANFQDKIINAIKKSELRGSGFSEFETYGTYVTQKHPGTYVNRSWTSMRYGGFFFDSGCALTKNQVDWLGKKYDAITFEKGHAISPLKFFVDSALFHLLPANSLEIMSFIIRAKRKLLHR